jgi:chemotaxis protein CheX
MAQLSEDDLRFFSDTVREFFTVSTGVPTTIAAAYLATETVRTSDFTGVISLSGAFRGQVLVSAPRLMLREFLLKQGETDVSEPNLLDAVGEIANTLAGNARRRFGNTLDISVPVTLRGAAGAQPRLRERPLLIALRWSRHEALVCVDLERA